MQVLNALAIILYTRLYRELLLHVTGGRRLHQQHRLGHRRPRPGKQLWCPQRLPDLGVHLRDDSRSTGTVTLLVVLTPAYWRK
jgi:hypothetical protein